MALNQFPLRAGIFLYFPIIRLYAKGNILLVLDKKNKNILPNLLLFSLFFLYYRRRKDQLFFCYAFLLCERLSFTF